MLSISFCPDREWWVSGVVFDKLFQSALDNGDIPPALEYYRHVADANGGLDISSIEPSDADGLEAGLRRSAERELTRLGEGSTTSDADAYRVSLRKLLKVFAPR